MGLARDRGLLLPVQVPDVRDCLTAWQALPYRDLAVEIMRLYADLPTDELWRIVAASYTSFRAPEVTPVVPVGPLHVLELFHGPTLAFKDVALQFLGNLFERLLQERGGHLTILGATSGDTGSAAICGVRAREAMRIFVMHPHGRISAIQERQMTSVLDDNVFNLAVDGTFDDCQRIMKEIFGDLAFKDRYALGSVNSINWARLLAQIVYYFYAAFRVMERSGADRVRFAVPTGNFGDIFAGYLAARMGLPITRLVLATNENDILSRFFRDGDYSIGSVQPTLSPAMDIQVASNFERYLYYRTGECPETMRRIMEFFRTHGRLPSDLPEAAGTETLIVAGKGDTEATRDTIRRIDRDYDYLVDPHTAVGISVAMDHLDDDEPMICLATAHPAKFPDAIRTSIGRDAAHHPLIDALEGMPTRCETIGASVETVKTYIADHAAGGERMEGAAP